MKNLGKKKEIEKKRFLQEFMNCNDDVLFLAHISNAYLFCFIFVLFLSKLHNIWIHTVQYTHLTSMYILYCDQKNDCIFCFH